MSFDSRLKDKSIDELFKAIMTLDNLEECYSFFEDLCTVTELKSLAQRLAVAELLSEDATYEEIKEQTGASSATISRVNKCLNYGADGYQLILKKMKK